MAGFDDKLVDEPVCLTAIRTLKHQIDDGPCRTARQRPAGISARASSHHRPAATGLIRRAAADDAGPRLSRVARAARPARARAGACACLGLRAL